MRFTVFNDIHIGAPHEMKGFQPFDNITMVDGSEVILNGDIVDYQNCSYENMKSCLALITYLKSIYGDKYILGNHELEAVPCPGFYKSNNVLFKHGDWEFWGSQRRMSYMNLASPGAGWFKRSAIMRQLHWLSRIWSARYSKSFKERAAKAAKEKNCDTIVFGHKHPRKPADFMYDGVRIIVLKRGRNEIDA